MFTSLLPPSVVSCVDLPSGEYFRRTEAAYGQENHLRANYNHPQGCYGKELIWHPAFPAELIATVGTMPLYEIAQWVGSGLGRVRDEQSEGEHLLSPMDAADYGYLADVLREGLADNPTPLAALRLGRALYCVERAGNALLPQVAAGMSIAA